MLITEEKINKCRITLYGYLRMHARADGAHPYLICENRTVSYAEALETVQGLASELLRRGMKKGDLVALRATRSADVALLSSALCAVGAVIVLTDAHFDVKDYIARSGVDIEPHWWLTDERTHGVSEPGRWELEKSEGAPAALDIGAYAIDAEAVERASANVRHDDAFLIIFTSGSTGKSKAVTLSHCAVVANPVDAMPLFEENADDVAIALLPLNHVFGFCVISCATFCGHAVVFPPDTDIEAALGYIEKYRVSCIYAVPTFFLGLLSADRHKSYDISSLRIGLMAGGPFTENQLRFIEDELGMRLMPGYGMSECVGISTMRYGDTVAERAAGVGRPYPMTEVFILDDDGNELSTGETGEICVRGMTMMSGYYNNEQETRAAFDGNGRLHTGDLGYFTADGILHVNGRKKDIIIRGGENISAVKIERALLSVEGVYQAVAVGVADGKWGEVPCAAVVPRKGVSADEAQIKRESQRFLSKHEVPSRILIMEEFPLTASGKPDKQKIKELFDSK